MKLLSTVAFVLLVAARSYLGYIQQRWALETIRGRRRNSFLLFLFLVLTLLLDFAAFGVLTHRVPYYLILALLAASLLTTILNLLIGAIAGFGVEDSRRKIGALWIIAGAGHPGSSCAAVIATFIYLAVSWLGSLWVFWTRPIGDPNAAGWIAFYQFFLPQLILVPLGVAMMWPVVTSEFIDDDVRKLVLVPALWRDRVVNCNARFSGVVVQTGVPIRLGQFGSRRSGSWSRFPC